MLKVFLSALALVCSLQVAPAAAQRPEQATEVQPLLVGTAVPAVSGLIDMKGAAFDLGAAIKGKPTVLVFYRGHW